MTWSPLTFIRITLPGVIAVGMALGFVISVEESALAAPSRWEEANKLAAAIGGWRVYMKERATAPEGYPTTPAASEALLPAEVLDAVPSVETRNTLATWESRRFAERSASLAPPTLTYSREKSDEESIQEYGIHLPVGSWIGRGRSLAADESGWGTAEQQALRYQASRNRLVLYAEAVAAKTELAQAMDRLEVQKVLEELTSRQLKIAAIPESELLSLRIDGFEAQAAVANARGRALLAVERLALEIGLPLSKATTLLRRLPLELKTPKSLPALEVIGRLDVRQAEQVLEQRKTALARAETTHWLGDLEMGLLQERSDSGEVSNTVEFSWRLPIGGESRRRIDMGERTVEQLKLQVDVVRRNAAREQAAANRAKKMMATQLERAIQALEDAELWMEEQVYRYSGMLISPHDLLRAAARLRAVRSVHLEAQRMAFVSSVNLHFVRAISMRISTPQSAAPATAAADAGH